MDQFASMMGKKGHVIRLDCGTLDYQYFPFAIDGYKVLLLDTQVKHSLASSEYNTRRQECEQGIKWIQEKHPEVKTLRNATMQMLDDCVKEKDATVYKRCKFIVEEIERVQLAGIDLEIGDMQAFGKKMLATHEGLSKLYEVSCTELDYIVEYIRNNPNVLGCRMMGGGFGGCVISLVKNEAIERLVAELKPAYKIATGLDMKNYVANIGDGTGVFNG
jgi:galactokinase